MPDLPEQRLLDEHGACGAHIPKPLPVGNHLDVNAGLLEISLQVVDAPSIKPYPFYLILGRQLAKLMRDDPPQE